MQTVEEVRRECEESLARSRGRRKKGDRFIEIIVCVLMTYAVVAVLWVAITTLIAVF